MVDNKAGQAENGSWAVPCFGSHTAMLMLSDCSASVETIVDARGVMDNWWEM